MNNQDSGTMIITFLLLLPWLGRTAVSAVAIWREHMETQGGKAKLLNSTFGVTSRPILRLTSVNGQK